LRYQLFSRAGRPFSNETELRVAFGLVWCGTEFDVNREVNNGRGPVDFKVSFGADEKSLIEFKLASNSSLKRNLEKQVEIYEAVNRTRTSVKAIVIYSAAERQRLSAPPRTRLGGRQVDLPVDARSDNKPSASKA
jgi:hypothetical protein